MQGYNVLKWKVNLDDIVLFRKVDNNDKYRMAMKLIV